MTNPPSRLSSLATARRSTDQGGGKRREGKRQAKQRAGHANSHARRQQGAMGAVCDTT